MGNLSHIAAILPVNKMSAVVAYFVQLLGFQVYFQTQDPVDYVVVKRDGITINLSLVDAPASVPSNNSAYIFCEDVAALYQEYQRKGVSFREELNTTDYGMKEFVLEIPSGHRLAFGQGVS